MVCDRCKWVVSQIFESEELPFSQVGLGFVEIDQPLNQEQKERIDSRLQLAGFEILDDQNHKIIEQIKNRLIELIQQKDIPEHFSLGDYLSKSLLKDYAGLSRLFSQVEGITIEQYFIKQKIEKAKELLFYGELTLSEIAWMLGYSSVQHLSTQFKKITGLTPSQMKNMIGSHRQSLDQIK